MSTLSRLTAIQGARALALRGDARRIRESAGVSLSEVAAVLGVEAKTISRWELGESAPRAGNAVRYRALLARLESAIAATGVDPIVAAHPGDG